MEFGSEGDTIQLGLWEKGQLTLKRRLGGGVTKVLTQVTEDEVDKVHAAVRESHKEVATAFDMAQVARRAQLRASDAQVQWRVDSEQMCFAATEGKIIVLVDDLMDSGNARHRKLPELLRKKYRFG